MKALVVKAPWTMQLHDVPMHEPSPEEVRVRVGAVGLCRRDVELLEGRHSGSNIRYPVIPGHEWAGTVDVVGEEVHGIVPGNRVVAEGVRSCRTCARCREGTPNLCASPFGETGFTHAGAFAEYVSVPARLVHRLPDDASLGAAALLEPAACVATGLLAGDLRPGMTVAVVGAGTLGLLAVALLNLVSPARLALVGKRIDRLVLGRRLGASEAWTPGEGRGTGEFDLVFEATNAPTGATEAVELARRGGTVILEGISGVATPALDPDAIFLGQLGVKGVFGASSPAWIWVIDLFSRGLFDPSPLVTHRFSLDRYEDAFAAIRDRSVGAIKVQVTP